MLSHWDQSLWNEGYARGRAGALEEAAETIEQINANHLTRQEVVAAIRALKERKL